MRTIEQLIDDDKRELDGNTPLNPQRKRYLQNDLSELELRLQKQGDSTMTNAQHNLDHEVYLDPKDKKEHINHGMLEYSEEDLKTSHAYYDEYHKNDEVNKNEGKINDYHTRHEDLKLELYCENHPDAFECRVYDE